MMTHYRRISKTALNVFRTSLIHDGVKPSEYDALGFSGAVKVGTETGGYIILEVMGEDREGLPGKLVSKTFGDLSGAARSAVHRTKIKMRSQDEEGNDVDREELIPANMLPEGIYPLPIEGPQTEETDCVLAEGINPHRFI
jgi:hypothetical protein